MPDRLAIYRNNAKTYDLLISREDHEGNLLKALRSICDFSDKDIADLGAGTGRLALLLAPYIRSALLTDSAGPMLDVAKEHLTRINVANFSTHVCDIGTVPADDASFDVVLPGWRLFLPH
jgi:ubiquinone/menaquinone biosynthesis C-methylase UbiE